MGAASDYIGQGHTSVCEENLSRTKRYVLALSVFILLLAAGIGALSPREAAAQLQNPNCTSPDVEVDLTCNGLELQSQADPYWEDSFVDQNYVAGDSKKATIERCGCFLAVLSTVMNYTVAKEGGHPHFLVNPGGPNPYAWNIQYQFTPEYLDRYLSYGRLEYGEGDLPMWWGYKQKLALPCGTYPDFNALSQAGKPSSVIGPDGQVQIIGRREGIRLDYAQTGLDTGRIDRSLKAGLPVIVDFNVPSGTGRHAQLIVGKRKDGTYLVLDPYQSSLSAPYIPGGPGDFRSSHYNDSDVEYTGVKYDSYDDWKRLVRGTFLVDPVEPGKGTPRAIVANDDPSAFEFLTTGPDGLRTGYDPATQTQIKEDPSISSYDLGPWADPTGVIPPGGHVKGVEVIQPVDGTYRFQVIGTGDGPAKFSFSTFFGRRETILKEVDQPITEGELLKYELEYSATGESSVSEVSNFTPEARPHADSPVTAGEPVAFDGSDSFDVDGSVESYEWDFGGGATSSGSGASHTYEKPGEYTATLKVTDDKGATDTTTTRVKIDPTETAAPTTTATLSPEPDADGWNKDDVTVSFSATDGEGGSGVESITYSVSNHEGVEEATVQGDSAQFQIKTEGYTTIHYRARDKMDNIEEEKTLEVRLDKTGPRNAVQIPADGAKVSPDSGSLLSLRTIAGTADDPLSGVASVQVSLRREGDGSYWDGSGWVEGEQWLDTTGLGATGTASWSRSAGLPSGDTLPEGSYAVRSRATDRLGNTAYSVSNTFIVEEGLETSPTPPPDMAGTKLSEDNSVLTGNCDDWGNSTVNFEASGLATGSYPGTFTESGTATLGELQSTGSSPLYDIEVNFTIISSAGKVTGTKRFVAGSSGGSGACVETWSGTKNLGVTARSLSYEATIETPADCEYVDRGTSSVQAIDSEAFTTNPFSESYTSDSSPPEPVPGSTCSVDREAPRLELPADITQEATSKDGAEVAFTASATDEEPAKPEVTCAPSSGSIFPLGATTVNCSATDRAGNEARGSFEVTVRDTTPPETGIDSGPDGPTEDDTPTFTFSGSDKVTSDADLLFSYQIDDAEPSPYSRETSATLGGSAGLDPGPHIFYVWAKDEVGNQNATPAKRSFTVEPPNSPPTADAGGPYEAREGGSAELRASGSDPEGRELTYEWDLDGDGTFETSGQNAVFSAANLDGPSSHPVRLQVKDPEGLSATDEAAVSVTNAAPAATFHRSAPVDEGSPFDLSLDDPSDASKPDERAGFTYAFDCGNGYGSFGREHVTSCPTEDNGTRSVGAKIRDKDGDTTGYTGSVYVSNVAPAITGISGPSQVLTGKAVSFQGSAIDPSSADMGAGLRWRWSVDGGAYSPGPNPFGYTFSGCGEYTLSATAEDKDGGTSEPASTGVVTAYAGHYRQPLDEGAYNLVQAGRVVPVKVTVGCEGQNLSGLRPPIQLLRGDKSDATETSSENVETYSVSAADTTGVMREIGGGYIYNLQVPARYADGSRVRAGDRFTIRVRPFGDANKEASMYVVLEIR